MEARHDIWHLKASDIMNENPKCIKSGALAARALAIMEEFSINQLIVINDENRPEGMLHLHDLLKAGLAE
jgi:arabinose-5-phosphate isomerase